MLKRAILILALAVTMIGCPHRMSVRPPEPAFPVVMTRLPEGYSAWVCEFKNGGSYQVCDAAVENGNLLCWNTTDVGGMTCELKGKYIRVDQPNGLVVYWRARMMQ